MQNDDAEFVARLKSMTNAEINWNREGEYWRMVRGERVVLATIFLYFSHKTRALNGLYRVRLHSPTPHLARYPDGTVRMFQLAADAKSAAEKLVEVNHA